MMLDGLSRAILGNIIGLAAVSAFFPKPTGGSPTRGGSSRVRLRQATRLGAAIFPG